MPSYQTSLILLLLAFAQAEAKVFSNFEDVQHIKYDFIVVGGGTAGNVIANRLTENSDFNVLVLEAGPSNAQVLQSQVPWLAPTMWNSDYDWNYTTVSQAALGGRVVGFPRGHILGGTSSINFLMYTRGSSDQYDDWARITKDPGWSWKNLKKYFDKNERWTAPADNHNTTGQFDPASHSFNGVNSVSLAGFPSPIDDRVINATRELGGQFKFNLDYSSGNPLGIGWLQNTVGAGQRSSSATSYLGPQFIKRPNLHVLVGAQVGRLIQTSGGHTPGFRTVEFRQRPGGPVKRVSASKEVVVSAGAVGSPQVLLNSGIGPEKHLRSVGVKTIVDLPDVGANFADHCAVALPWLVNSNATFERTKEANVSAQLLQQWSANHTGPFVDTLTSQLGFFRVDDASHHHPAVGPNTPHYEFIISNGLIVPNPLVPPEGHFFSIATALLSPASRGSIRLRSNDPFDFPLIDPAYMTNDADKKVMRTAIRKAMEFVTAPSWSGYIIAPSGGMQNLTTDASLDTFIEANTGTFFHPTSSNMMTFKGAKTGVVDPDGRVKHVDGVRVVDASIFVPLFSTFYLLTLLSSCNALIYDTVSALKNQTFDFIIVGGGTAGNVVANRLSENPKFKVLVIEAGPSHEGVLSSEVPFFAANNWFSAYDWNYTTTPQVGLGGRPTILPRGHILGGSSSINFLMYTRSTIEDYDRIAKVTGDKGWSWKGLQPYFKKNEKFVRPADKHNNTGQFDPSVHSFDGLNSVSIQNSPTPIDSMVVNASHQLGGDFTFKLDYNDGKPLGLGWLQTTVDGPTGSRSSSATAYLAPRFLKRPNLRVLVNAQVSRLIQTHGGKSPSFLTVEFKQGSGSSLYRLTASREVILSAGALGTPHILLNSGVGDSKALRAVGITPLVDLPDVGANLADHSAIANPFVARSNNTFEDLRKPDAIALLLKQWKANKTGALTNTVASLISFHRVTGDDVPHPDPAAGPNTPHFEHLYANGLIVPNSFVPADQHIFSVATALVSPSSRGSLTINSTNPFDPPLIDPALLKDESDRRMMRAALRHAFKFVTAPALANYVIGPAGDLANATTDAQLDAYMDAEAGTFFHPTGTAAMSPKGAKNGVLDPDLKVKKISGLRVVDASVFPDIPSGHTQAAVYVIAERAADIIKDSHSK
ncbi:hypothetical protein DXG01_004624 [Tephrocybe rancida]|nr:hypothetical protein DXG01_004624 [Tephrocybe rancida]